MRRRRPRKKPKHDGYIDDLVRRLKDKPYVKEVFRNVEVSNGEYDVLYKTHNDRLVYIEVKTNHHWKAYNKGRDQLVRFTRTFHPMGYERARKCGVYWTPQKIKYIVSNDRGMRQ